jgi:dihydrofolate reductase
MDNVNLIWMQSNNGVIGCDGQLPFKIPEDIKRFKELTMGGIVVMGRKTWESLPSAYRPLPGRYNVVLTNNRDYVADEHPYVEVIHDLEDFLIRHRAKKIWVIGGAEVYHQAIRHAKSLYVTRVLSSAIGDALAPVIQEDVFRCTAQTAILHSEHSGEAFRYEQWVRHRVIRYTKVNK